MLEKQRQSMQDSKAKEQLRAKQHEEVMQAMEERKQTAMDKEREYRERIE